MRVLGTPLPFVIEQKYTYSLQKGTLGIKPSVLSLKEKLQDTMELIRKAHEAGD